MDIYKIILFFISPDFLLKNFQQFANLIKNYQINKFNQYILFLSYKNMEKEFINYLKFSNFNCKYVYDIKELEKIIKELYENIKQNDSYKKNIKLTENILFYKFIIDKYLYLFNTSIYYQQKKYDQNELLFTKISQDIQFLNNFEFDENISLNAEIKEKINNINNKEDINEIIDGFIKYSKIIFDIKNIIIEFEKNIDSKIMINEKKTDKDNKTNNIENKNDNEINQTLNKNQKKESCDKSKMKNINSDEQFDMKGNKYINLNNDEDVNNLANNIKKCIKNMEKQKNNEEKEKQNENGKTIELNFSLLISQIEDNLKIKIKNELLIILYLILQKSITHKFENEFIEILYKNE